MEIMDKTVALLLIRLVAGILFITQAYDKIFNVGVTRVAETFGIPLGQRRFKSSIAVALSSYVEMIAGALLILGLFRSFALYVLATDMIMVALAFSLIKPMWDMQYYFPRLALVVALLLLPAQWDCFTLDYLFFRT